MKALVPLLAITLLSAGEKGNSCDDPCKMVMGYNAPDAFTTCNCYTFFLSGSFTYWQPIQENMKLGVLSNSSGALDLVNGNVVDLHYKFKPGFKVAAGVNFDYDNWDSTATYTWFNGTERVNVTLDPTNTSINLLPAWQISNFLNPQYNASASEKWKLSMNIVDLDLGRNYFVGTKLTWRPFMGMRAAFINQHVNVAYINTNPSYVALWPSTYVTQSSTSWAVGPEMGLSTLWKFCGGFALHSAGEFDILFTQYNTKMTQHSAVAVPSYYIINQNNAIFLRPHADLTIGLNWGRSCFDSRVNFNLLADYTFQIFFSQNTLRRTLAAQSAGISFMPNGNLYIQGLIITLRADF